MRTRKRLRVGIRAVIRARVRMMRTTRQNCDSGGHHGNSETTMVV